MHAKKYLTIVIAMAGDGNRFLQAGYCIPKYKIIANGISLFEWSIISLTNFNDVVYEYIFVVKKADHAQNFIISKCRELKIQKFRILEIENKTDGQASTVMFASTIWNKDTGLLIYNIDTYIEPQHMHYSQLSNDGIIYCFEAHNKHFSFVKTNIEKMVIEVKEKQPISNLASAGAYYFRSCALYEELYTNFYLKNLQETQENEKYVIPIYNYLINKGGIVYAKTINSKYVHILGTPKELSHFIKNKISLQVKQNLF